ncbi:MAG: pyrroline-5-carboxylate reductase [Ruminococcaceae bacterium]|nr:pyrroline-5-carboxylate reductase [Oscillospiraceae bacterium]
MKIGIIGLGQMGHSIARGLLASKAVCPENLYAAGRNIDRLREKAEKLQINACACLSELLSCSDIVVLAVKPYQLREVIAPVAEQFENKIVVSVLAGVSHDEIKSLLPQSCHVQCVIPNTPVAVGKGVWICEEQSSLTAEDRAVFEEIFGKTGIIEYVKSGEMDIAGSLAGCGPAVAAMFLDALSDVGVRYGLSRHTAYRLASAMLVGTGTLASETGEHPGALKDNVCSPGGTTIRGVIALEENGFRGSISKAFSAIMES